jgi:protein gp37
MNRTKIEWCDYTWNPVTGCWGPGGTREYPRHCAYCYAQRLAERFMADGYGFMPHFWPERLDQPERIKKPSRIFVCSMGDLFGDWVPDKWIAEVQQVAHDTPRHTFIFLTKNPARYAEFNPWPKNCWLLTTCENQAAADERIPELLKADCRVRGVSLEPLLGAVDLNKVPYPDPYFKVSGREGVLPDPKESDDYVWSQKERGARWLIIGAMTGPGSKTHQPKPEWIQSLIDQARAAGVPVFLKDNLKWPEKIQEWPV